MLNNKKSFKRWFVNSLVNIYLISSTNKDAKEWLTNSVHVAFHFPFCLQVQCSFSLPRDAICLLFYYSAVILPGLSFKCLDNIHLCKALKHTMASGIKCRSPQEEDFFRCRMIINPSMHIFQFERLCRRPAAFINRAILLCIEKSQRKIPQVHS